MKLSFFVPAKKARAHNQYSAPLGLGYLSSYLKSNSAITDIDIHIDFDELIESKPDIVGMTAFSQDYTQALFYSEKIKNKLNIPVIIGGYHISALPKSLGNSFLVGVIGEGEETFSELINLHSKNKLNEDFLSDVRGIVTRREDGSLLTTEKRPLIKDIDTIPYPDRNLFHTPKLPWVKSSNYQVPVYSSRGCPFRCIFCIHSELKASVRNHSVQRVTEEIEYIVDNYPAPLTICFFDDLFALNKKRLLELAESVISKGLHKKASFACTARASVFNEEICEIFKSMNMTSIAFGMESGVEHVIKYLKGSYAKVSENRKAVDLCNKYDFMCHGYFITGSPVETFEDLSSTYWFLRSNQPPFTSVNVYSLVPFPGTKFWYEAIEKELVSEDLPDWGILNFENFKPGETLFMNSHYSPEEYKKAYDHFEVFKQKNEQMRITVMAKEKLKEQLRSSSSEFSNFILKEQKLNSYKILELSPYESYLEEFIPDAEVLNHKPDYNINDNIEPGTFDTLFFNYSSNSFRNWDEVLNKNIRLVKNKGLIGISFFNLLFSHTFLSMLQGTWTNIYNTRTQMDSVNFLTVISLQKYIAKSPGLELVKINSTEVSAELKGNDDFINGLAKYLGSKELYEYKNVSSFLFVIRKIN